MFNGLLKEYHPLELKLEFVFQLGILKTMCHQLSLHLQHSFNYKVSLPFQCLNSDESYIIHILHVYKHLGSVFELQFQSSHVSPLRVPVLCIYTLSFCQYSFEWKVLLIYFLILKLLQDVLIEFTWSFKHTPSHTTLLLQYQFLLLLLFTQT